MYNIFFFVWSYYTFSVPIDLMLGLKVAGLGRHGENLPDLNESYMLPYVMEAVAYYLLCALFFWLAYKIIVPRRGKRVTGDKEYHVFLPPLWLMILIHMIALVMLINFSWGLDRQGRALLAGESVIYKFFGIFIELIKALDSLYIIASNNRRASLYGLLGVSILGLAQGSRTTMLLFVLMFVARWRIRFSRKQLLLLVFLVLPLLAYWKLIYGYIIESYAGYDPVLQLQRYAPNISLSNLEASSSFTILVDYLSRGNCPYWLGSSYIEIPLSLTLPRFLSETRVLTLAENYISTVAPQVFERGGGMGFSSVAESWLNFGVWGPAVLGTIWGTLARFFDSRRRGIAFYVLALMTYRLFRSDFASLYKSWIVVFGGTLVVVFLLLSLFHLFAKEFRKTFARRAVSPGRGVPDVRQI